MYLDTFLLIVLSAGTVLATECPKCGSTISMQDCDANIEMQSCDFATSRCITNAEPGIHFYARQCVTDVIYERVEASCNNKGNCHLGSCKQPGCKAVFNECPSCTSETSLEDCDTKIKMERCDFATERCAVYKEPGYYYRECMDNDYYTELVTYCSDCSIASCIEPGCKAELQDSDSE